MWYHQPRGGEVSPVGGGSPWQRHVHYSIRPPRLPRARPKNNTALIRVVTWSPQSPPYNTHSQIMRTQTFEPEKSGCFPLVLAKLVPTYNILSYFWCWNFGQKDARGWSPLPSYPQQEEHGEATITLTKVFVLWKLESMLGSVRHEVLLCACVNHYSSCREITWSSCREITWSSCPWADSRPWMRTSLDPHPPQLWCPRNCPLVKKKNMKMISTPTVLKKILSIRLVGLYCPFHTR